ncbi:MAG: radical SAM protein [Deltaproteobacteria bacterium]|nr:radical SAM protein [Deltaproteobacteria bacterium]
MLPDLLDHGLLRLPVVGNFYRRRSATLKRRLCLLLNRFGMLKPYTFVQWLATNSCNLFCPYCESSSGLHGPDELDSGEVKALLDALSAMGVGKLVISGGEPLMRGDILELMEYANRRSLRLGLVTNGWFVPELLDGLRRLRFFLYFTSIDGIPGYHDGIRGREGAFERAVNGLDLFAGMGVPVRMVNTVVHPGNISQLDRIAEVVKESAATAWRITPVSRVGRAESGTGYALDGAQLRYLADFVRAKRKVLNVDLGESHMYLGCFGQGSGGKPFFCGAGLTRCSIMPNGDVFGCHQVFDPLLSEGNVRDRAFAEMWQEGFTRFRSNSLPDTCIACPHVAACRGGCWAEREKCGTCLKPVWDEVE